MLNSSELALQLPKRPLQCGSEPLGPVLTVGLGLQKILPDLDLHMRNVAPLAMFDDRVVGVIASLTLMDGPSPWTNLLPIMERKDKVRIVIVFKPSM